MKEDSDNNWVSFSDIMTGLMIIFLFISVSYLMDIQNKQKDRDKIFEEFKATKEDLFVALNTEFQTDFQKWEVKLDNDLSIKFTNPEVLFHSGKKNIRDKFEKILDEFLPRYFKVVLQDKYKDKIAEIRIEGHTDTVPAPQYDRDPYIANILLSQQRSAEVVKYLRGTEYFRNLNKNQIKRVEFMLTANGLSYGRTVDDDGNLTLLTGEDVNLSKSRRVEFKIVTTSEQLIEQVLKEI